MKRRFLRKLLPWLVVAAVAAVAVYRLKFSPVPVTAYTMCMAEMGFKKGETPVTPARIGEVAAKGAELLAC